MSVKFRRSYVHNTFLYNKISHLLIYVTHKTHSGCQNIVWQKRLVSKTSDQLQPGPAEVWRWRDQGCRATGASGSGTFPGSGSEVGRGPLLRTPHSASTSPTRRLGTHHYKAGSGGRKQQTSRGLGNVCVRSMAGFNDMIIKHHQEKEIRTRSKDRCLIRDNKDDLKNRWPFFIWIAFRKKCNPNCHACRLWTQSIRPIHSLWWDMGQSCNGSEKD